MYRSKCRPMIALMRVLPCRLKIRDNLWMFRSVWTGGWPKSAWFSLLKHVKTTINHHTFVYSIIFPILSRTHICVYCTFAKESCESSNWDVRMAGLKHTKLEDTLRESRIPQDLIIQPSWMCDPSCFNKYSNPQSKLDQWSSYQVWKSWVSSLRIHSSKHPPTSPYHPSQCSWAFGYILLFDVSLSRVQTLDPERLGALISRSFPCLSFV
jgi:hypothetical protein